MKKVLIKLAKWIAKRYGFEIIYPRYNYRVTAITEGGEIVSSLKVNKGKRYSKNNRIIFWNLYENGKLKTTVKAK